MMWKPDWTRRDRTHLYVVPADRYAEQKFLTNRLLPSAQIFDWREAFLADARPIQKRLGVSVAGEIRRLQTICDSERRVVSVINAEYFLARFNERERAQFWLALWSDFPHLAGLLIFTALNSPALLPDDLTLENWRREGRLFRAIQ